MFDAPDEGLGLFIAGKLRLRPDVQSIDTDVGLPECLLPAVSMLITRICDCRMTDCVTKS